MAAFTEIDNPELYFQAKAYTGNGSSSHAITFDNTDTSMQPDLIWGKNRNNAEDNVIFDSVRGGTKRLYSNGNHVEGTNDAINSFDSNGFNLNTYSSLNYNTYTYVAWCWKESTTAGLDIIAYTGTGSVMNVSHNLSAVPGYFLIKNLDVDQAWRVFHKNMTTADPYSNRMVLSENTAQTTSALGLDADPTSSVINIDDGTGCTNDSSERFICYAWAEKQGFSKFGTYQGNGNVDGPTIWTGMRPAYFVTKRADSSNNWAIFDNKRSPSNLADERLRADESGAEGAVDTNEGVDLLSNGVKIRCADAELNASGGTYIYMAFAEAPFVNSNGVPCNAR